MPRVGGVGGRDNHRIETGLLDPFMAKLRRLAALDGGDLRALADLPCTTETVAAGTSIVCEGEASRDCCVLLGGYAFRHKLTPAGGRQILSFHMAGDCLDLQDALLGPADHSVQAMTQCLLARIPQDDIRRLAQANPRVGAALWRDTLVDGAVFREWVVNVGRRDARTRIAHMLCEFAERREAAGLGAPDAVPLPMTQEEIADATGLTSVHVNRMLRILADEGAVTRDRRKLRIADWALMRRIAQFDPAYLRAA